MEQNYLNLQVSQCQEFQQFNIDIETSDEAELRYKQFMEEEMNRKALLPKHLESSASNHEITESERQKLIQEEQEEQSYKNDKYQVCCACCFVIFLSVIANVFGTDD